MALPKGPLLAPIGRNMQEIHVADIAKEIAAEFQKSVPVNMSHQVNVTVDPIELADIEDPGSSDADKIVEALNAIHQEDPDNVRVTNDDPILVTQMETDAERTDAEVPDGEEEDQTENMIAVLESIDQNTNDTVEQLLDVEDAIRELGKSKEDEQDEAEEGRRSQQQTKTGNDKDPAAKEEKKSQGIVGKMFGGILKTVKKLFSGISLMFMALGAIVLGFMGSGATDVMKKVMDSLQNFMENALPLIIEGVVTIMEALLPAVMGIVDMVVNLSAKLVPIIVNLVEKLIPPIVAIATVIMDVVSQIVTILAPIIADILDKVVPPLTELFMSLGTMVAELVEFLMPVIEALAIFVGNIASGLGAVIGAVTSFVDAVISFFQGDTEKGMNLLKNSGDMLLVGIADLLNGVIEFFAGILDFIPGMGDAAAAVRDMKFEFGDNAQARIDKRGEEDGSTADRMEKEIDFDQDRASVKSAIEDKVATGVMSEEVGRQLLERYDEKKAAEEQANIETNPATKEPVITLADLFDSTADKEFVENKNMLPTDETSIVSSDVTVPASAVNEATLANNEMQKDLDAPVPTGGGDQVAVDSSQNINTKTVITTGVIGTGGDSSLGHRHRRVLPGVA